MLAEIRAIEVPKDFLEKVSENNKFNQIIYRYYKKLSAETNRVDLSVKAATIRDCNTIIEIDKYTESKIKDYLRTNLCRDKFCSNCKKLKQAARMAKYAPILKKANKIYNLYHMVLTVPNCSAQDLEKVIKKMIKKFKRLIQILRGEIKIKGLEFEETWGFAGAVRSLEVTFKSNFNDSNCFHAHFHVALALEHDGTILGEKHIENKFSKSKKSGFRLFSEEEILIQKIWRLLMTDQRVTKKSIDELEIGYSCTLDEFKEESDIIEIFKYMTKGVTKNEDSGDDDETEKVFSYKHFKTLYFVLHRVKQVQGYGIFYRISDDVTEEEIEKANTIYDKIVEYLQNKEIPTREINSIQELLEDTVYMLISRKRILKNLIKIMREPEGKLNHDKNTDTS